MSDFQFEIVKHIKTLSTNAKGWSKEFNLVSWNKRAPKYDIREWDEEHLKMSKGITFTEDEIAELKEGLIDI
ncbi:hypothetical protein SAMN02745245_01501 [Anaerosphaera aminiphila DSM 21120]|uniref:Transcriptional coactivator p15 (PC4) C-terminal domain-containing protein n=1 Tax=Anaerosphaera aminiphila DSM 21120 TaxID=1120995 RepID=A0A1M5TK31_9FIRM|nr:PC4/YdbC family ssDNA-binding protein [Anaerosphaera aminiphila]SHH51049.1 hypothetical protein SAMN02745245_01501 [Anaerosphaera aminiphila DSM 21120]